jgi:hypothetical protein
MEKKRFEDIQKKVVAAPPAGASREEWEVIFRCAERWQAHVFATLKDMVRVASGQDPNTRTGRDVILAYVDTIKEAETHGQYKQKPNEFIDEN